MTRPLIGQLSFDWVPDISEQRHQGSLMDQGSLDQGSPDGFLIPCSQIFRAGRIFFPTVHHLLKTLFLYIKKNILQYKKN